MEIATSVGTSLAETATTAAASGIWEQVRFVLDYKDNVQNLQSKVEALRLAKTRVIHDVEAARKRLEEIEEDVKSWLASVDKEIAKAEEILANDGAVRKSCCLGLLPNVKTRHRFSMRAKKETPVVEELARRGNFNRVGYTVPPKGFVPSKNYEAFESREVAFNSVVEALKNSKINIVGVWGLGGVGKTTMVKKVADQVLAEGIFERMAKTEVTQNPDLKKIQSDVSGWLDFKIEAEDIDRRATLLHERLKKEKSVIVILDNVWKCLDLEKVGIPTGGGDTEKNACKILITTRNQQVLFDMGVGKQSCFQLNALSEEEARKLFDKNVGDIQDPETQSIASEIVTRCGGLPVLILPVATALKNRQLQEWRDARARLEKFDKKDEKAQAYATLELSYSFLEEDAKSLFLLCGILAPSNIDIPHLLRYCFPLGMFEQCKTLQATRNRLLKVINDIKSSSLLLEGDNFEKFRMHDVVHSFAISSSKDHHSLVVAHGGILEEWPAWEVLQDYTTISLPFCTIPELPTTLECPKLVSFRLWDRKYHRTKLSNDFFREMKKLRLLELYRMDLSPLPSSFELLKNLQLLELSGCILEDISIIGELKNLQFLRLDESTIVHLPRQIENLTRLRSLDLQYCQNLQVIPLGILSCLTQLEELYMGDSFQRWGEGNNAKLAELKSLPNLTTLEIQIKDAKRLSEDIFFKNLERFRIYVGDDWDWPRKYESPRTLKFKLDKSFRWMEKVRSLLKGTENLYLDGLGGIGKDLHELDMDGFPQLKNLHMQNCPGLRQVVSNALQVNTPPAFPKLESFCIENSQDLEKICNGPLANGALNNLRVLEVASCDSLKSFFPISITNGLSQLEKIKVTDCKIMEEIFTSDTDCGKEEALEFTQLRKLTLQCLPRLTRFYSGTVKASSLRHTRTNLATGSSYDELAFGNKSDASLPLFSENILLPNLEDLELSSIKVQKIWEDKLQESYSFMKKLTSLVVSDCENLKYLFISSMVESLAQLKKLDIADCKSMEEIIVVESQGKGKMTSKIVFPKLEYVKLKRLQKLITFCTSDSIECPKLNEVLVINCYEMKTFNYSSKSYGDTAIFNDPKMMNVTLFDNKIRMPKSEIVLVREEMIWHNQLIKLSSYGQNLTRLLVDCCENINYLFGSSVVKCLGKLKRLEICDCKFMEQVVVSNGWGEKEMMCRINFSQLNFLRIKDLPQLTRFCVDATIECPVLKELSIENCPKLEQFVFRSVAIDAPTSSESVSTNSVLFDEKVLFPNLETLVLYYVDNLKMIWCDKIPIDSFYKLRTIRITHAEQLFKIFPSNMLRRFQNVEEISIKNCCSVEEVFDIQELARVENSDAVLATKLKTLEIEDVQMLKHVWNDDPQEIVDFQDLQSVHVRSCQNLKALFPASAAKSLRQLEVLRVVECGLEEIVGGDKGDGEDIAFHFPRVKRLSLFDLPKLRCFYPGVHSLNFPVLEDLRVFHCPNVEIFSFEPQNPQKMQMECQHEVQFHQPFLSFEKVIPNLKVLSLRKEDAINIYHQSSTSAKSSHKVMNLWLECVHDRLSDFPFDLLQRFENLEDLVMRGCSHFNEVFQCEILSEKKHAGNLMRIRSLTLDLLPGLSVLWNQEVPVVQVFQNLKYLYLWRCDSLIYLEPSLASLQNLMLLDLWRCEGLVSIMTLSTVRVLVRLEVLEVRECNRVTEIVSNEGKEGKDNITFRKLRSLKLDTLTSLSNFCSAPVAIKFPNLDEVKLIHCHKMKAFSQGMVSTPKLESVIFTERTDKKRWKGNLNTTIQHWYSQMNAEAE